MWQNYDKNNVFARIIRGEIPTTKVYEDENVLAIKDLNPQARIHVLVLPKTESISFDDFMANEQEKTISTFFKTVRKIAHDLGIGDGYKVQMNVLPKGGQEVPHLHVHLLAD